MSLLDPRVTYAPFEYQTAYKYWELQQQSHWLHCVAKDQLVVTSNGMMTVEELYNFKDNLILFNNKKAIRSSPMMRTAFRQLYKLHTKEGYTHSITKDHRVMTSTGWVEAQNLKENDLICIQTNEGLFGKDHNPELAYLAGNFQCSNVDADNNSHIIFQVWQKEYNLFISKIENCIKTVYNKAGLCNKGFEIPKFNINSDDTLPKVLIFKNDHPFNFVKNKIPDFVLKGDKETVRSYLEGLFDVAAVCYQHNVYTGVTIADENLEFMQNLQILLLNFGIKSMLSEHDLYFRRSVVYTLEVNEESSLIKLNNLIDIFKKRGKVFNKNYEGKKSHLTKYVKFSHLEKLKEDDVYCVSVDTQDHAWICNGFITHNTEISMASDINDWKLNLSEAEKNIIGHILKGFTQSEIFIQEYWGSMVSKWFKKPEIQMMAAAFASMESVHAVSYAYLNQSLGLEDFDAFLHEPSAKAKIDRLIATKGKSKEEIAKSLAIFSAFNEGVNLFSSFAVLLNFSRFNKLKGVGQIIAFSIKDESLHSEAGCWLFRVFVEEYPTIMTDELKAEIYDAARLTVELEDAFISKAFAFGEIEGITEAELKNFIRFRANTKLEDLGFKKNWKNIDKDLLKNMEWFDVMSSGTSHSDFFASRVDQYSKGTVDFSTIWDEDK